ncbi:SHOCT domain-containing protein [Sulfurimonas sp.]
MRLKTNIILIILAAILFFSGCSKDVEEYNKPAVYWYSKIISSIADSDLEKADAYYTSLQGEHIGSPLLPEATMILAIAHMHYEEYLLSEHFANEYMKRYANANEREFAEFMKIKAKYMALPNPRRDQVLIQDAIKEGEKFKINYPRSMYYTVVDTMLTNLRMAEAALNESIADLYVRLDKPRSAEYYRNIKPQHWMNWDEIDRAKTSWYRAWFEGDGTESWYGFMIPDTQSVVSRNTVQEEYIPQVQESVLEEAGIELLSEEQVSEIEKARELRDEGILSQEEYKDIKDEIINSKSLSEPEVLRESVPKNYEQDILDSISKEQATELKKAKDLMDEGVLSTQEFNALKDEILGN